MLKDWHTDNERLALVTHQALAYLGGYEDGSFDGLLGSDWARGIDPNSQPGHNAGLLLSAYRTLYALMGGDAENMQHWMQAPNTGTGGVPAEQVQSIDQLERVVSYLCSRVAKHSPFWPVATSLSRPRNLLKK